MTREEKNAYMRVRYAVDKEKYKEKRKSYREANKENKKEYSKKYRENNKEKLAISQKEADKKYYEANKEKISERQKISRDNNREKINHRAKLYRENNKEKVANAQRKYYDENKEKISAYDKNRRNNNRQKTRDYYNNKIKTDPLFRFASNLKSRTRGAFKKSGFCKKEETIKMLGCDFETARKHIEDQFTEGMNWENNTIHGWHIDHIIPIASAKTEEELIKLFHYTNLQPLWAKENWSKGKKLILNKKVYQHKFPN